MGERRIARNLWHRLAHIDPENMALNIKNIPEFGRFDDLYSLIGTPIEDKMWDFVKDKYNEDLENMKNKKPVSGLGKWLKSPNSKVKSTRNLGRLTAKKLRLNSREFARNLTNLRKYLDVVEITPTLLLPATLIIPDDSIFMRLPVLILNFSLLKVKSYIGFPLFAPP